MASPTQTFYQLTHPGMTPSYGYVIYVTVPTYSVSSEYDALAGYVLNYSTVTPGVGGAFYALSGADNTTSFGTNNVVSDEGYAADLIGSEFDVGASNQSSTALGLNVIGGFYNGTPTVANAYQISIKFSHPWAWGIVSWDGASNSFAMVGAKAAVANSDGQLIQLNVRDSTNTTRLASIQAKALKAGADLTIEIEGGSLVVNGVDVLAAIAALQAKVG